MSTSETASRKVAYSDSPGRFVIDCWLVVLQAMLCKKCRWTIEARGQISDTLGDAFAILMRSKKQSLTTERCFPPFLYFPVLFCRQLPPFFLSSFLLSFLVSLFFFFSAFLFLPFSPFPLLFLFLFLFRCSFFSLRFPVLLSFLIIFPSYPLPPFHRLLHVSCGGPENRAGKPKTKLTPFLCKLVAPAQLYSFHVL